MMLSTGFDTEAWEEDGADEVECPVLVEYIIESISLLDLELKGENATTTD